MATYTLPLYNMVQLVGEGSTIADSRNAPDTTNVDEVWTGGVQQHGFTSGDKVAKGPRFPAVGDIASYPTGGSITYRSYKALLEFRLVIPPGVGIQSVTLVIRNLIVHGDARSSDPKLYVRALPYTFTAEEFVPGQQVPYRVISCEQFYGIGFDVFAPVDVGEYPTIRPTQPWEVDGRLWHGTPDNLWLLGPDPGEDNFLYNIRANVDVEKIPHGGRFQFLLYTSYQSDGVEYDDPDEGTHGGPIVLLLPGYSRSYDCPAGGTTTYNNSLLIPNHYILLEVVTDEPRKFYNIGGTEYVPASAAFSVCKHRIEFPGGGDAENYLLCRTVRAGKTIFFDDPVTDTNTFTGFVSFDTDGIADSCDRIVDAGVLVNCLESVVVANADREIDNEEEVFYLDVETEWDGATADYISHDTLSDSYVQFYGSAANIPISGELVDVNGLTKFAIVSDRYINNQEASGFNIVAYENNPGICQPESQAACVDLNIATLKMYILPEVGEDTYTEVTPFTCSGDLFLSTEYATRVVSWLVSPPPHETLPESMYLALFVTEPSVDEPGEEVSAAGYARVALPSMEVVDLQVSNSEEISFPIAEEQWPEVGWVGFFDGDGVYVGYAPVVRVVPGAVPGTTLVLSPGSFVVRIQHSVWKTAEIVGKIIFERNIPSLAGYMLDSLDSTRKFNVRLFNTEHDEVVGLNYSSKEVTFTSASDGEASNVEEIVFDMNYEYHAQWTTANYIAVYSGGTIRLFSRLVPSVTLNQHSKIVISPGALSVTWR